jgi:hypothetical protein
MTALEVKMPTKAKTAPGRATGTAAASARARTGKRVTVRNVNHPGRTTQVDAVMYQSMRGALLTVLPAREPGMTLLEMRRRLGAHLSKDLFPRGAGVSWWAKTVQLDLEAKGVVARERSTPLRLHRTTR